MEVISPLTSPARWHAALDQHADATVFHTSAWAAVLSSTYGHQPFYFHCKESPRAGALIPIMEVASPLTGRRGICLPFCDFCGPLGDSDPGVLESELAALARRARWKYLEIRDAGSKKDPQDVAIPTFLAHELPLVGGESGLWDRMESANRRALRKSEKQGINVRVSEGPDDLEIFYHLHTLTRRRHGLPPQPLNFFRNLAREKLLAPGAGFIITATWKGRPVASAIFLKFAGRAIYKYGASDHEAWECRPNQPVMWAAIRHLANSAATILHFGRTTPGQEGLLRFKRSWGAAESAIFYRQYLPGPGAWKTVPPSPPEDHWPNHIFRHLPPTFNRWAGRLIYPHLD